MLKIGSVACFYLAVCEKIKQRFHSFQCGLDLTHGLDLSHRLAMKLCSTTKHKGRKQSLGFNGQIWLLLCTQS